MPKISTIKSSLAMEMEARFTSECLLAPTLQGHNTIMDIDPIYTLYTANIKDECLN